MFMVDMLWEISALVPCIWHGRSWMSCVHHAQGLHALKVLLNPAALTDIQLLLIAV